MGREQTARLARDTPETARPAEAGTGDALVNPILFHPIPLARDNPNLSFPAACIVSACLQTGFPSLIIHVQNATQDRSNETGTHRS